MIIQAVFSNNLYSNDSELRIKDNFYCHAELKEGIKPNKLEKINLKISESISPPPLNKNYFKISVSLYLLQWLDANYILTYLKGTASRKV